ncbi:MAG: hypothetical protein ACOC0B_01735 [bacterium]
MKLTSKNLSTLVILVVLVGIAGTFAWEILERFLSMFQLPLDLRVGPVGFDAGILSMHMLVNPGTIAGGVAGYRMFRKA